LHEQGEVPWDDLPADSNGLVPGVGEERAFNRDGLAMVLVGPPGVVSVSPDRQLMIVV
jgi:hypothetical protein